MCYAGGTLRFALHYSYMTAYRVLHFGQDGRQDWSGNLYLENEEEAIARARLLFTGVQKIEIWESKRKVYPLSGKAVSAGDGD